LIMDFFVYILQSQKDGTFYKGYTSDYNRRLLQHNQGKCYYTSRKMPWKIVYLEKCKSKAEAIKREKVLKRANAKYIHWLLLQDKNLSK